MHKSTFLVKIAVLGLLLAFLIWWVDAAILAADLPPASLEDGIWYTVEEQTIQARGRRLVVPDRYHTVAADADALRARLAQAPLERSKTTGVTLSLPLPDGTFARFQVKDSPIMAPELAAKFPQIKTYVAQGLDDPAASGRLDFTTAGFHAIIFSPQGTFYIDPYSQDDPSHYLSYFKRHFSSAEEAFNEIGPLGDGAQIEALVETAVAAGGISSGPERRTYRTAVATTGEYTQFHGGTVGDGMAAVVTTINRVTSIYEREVAVRLELIAGNDALIYTDSATDPYNNNNGFTMLGQNQANLDAEIGSSNYDIGHVFSTEGGGIASLGVVCGAGEKARGVTGRSAPVGDPFDVDYVSHEIGHQFGATHTFNGTDGSCGGNRTAATAYEPGSGSTIMAYAGICNSQDLQPNSDDFFHSASFDQIMAYTRVGDGDTCGTDTATSNLAPTVNAGTGGLTIPQNTPFTLTGAAADPDFDALTYSWEQFDLGPAGSPTSPSGNAPLFRSFPAVTTPARTFPQLPDIVNDTQTLGEILPGYTRALTFRLTARDNQGGVAYDTLALSATDEAGPFVVTAPDTAVVWPTGSSKNVTWEVANTAASPVNCAEVDILLSTDGGYTYSTTLAAGTPNDGSETIAVPNVTTSTARVKVACGLNDTVTFFDISNTNFAISGLGFSKSVSPDRPLQPGDVLTYTLALTNTTEVTTNVTITDTLPARVVNPVCNGVPGHLSATVAMGPDDGVMYECGGQVDPALGVDIEKTADQTTVAPGTAVTYTIRVTNTSPGITLTNLIVADPHVGSCLPALEVPATLEPLQSRAYVCPGVPITQTITNTATVTAAAVLANSATASAPEINGGPLTSNEVESVVQLTGMDTAVVSVENYRSYLPAIQKR